jgi:hypothetical protein
MPPFIQLRQPPNDDWVVFDLAVASVVSIRQPPDFDWVQYIIGGGGGAGGKFVREFLTIATMVADATLIAGDVCTCTDTEPNRWFSIRATADPLIRNVVLDVAGGVGLQAHQVPSAQNAIWIGPPRGGGVDDAQDINPALAYAQAQAIGSVWALPSVNWTIKAEVLCQSGVALNFNSTDVIDIELPGGVPFQPQPAGFLMLETLPPGALAHTLLAIDPPTNAWCAYEGGTTVLVVSVTVPSPIAVGDEVEIAVQNGAGNTRTVCTHEVIAITPSGGNFLLTLDPPIPWPVPKDVVSTIQVMVRPKNILLDGHNAIVTGTANRCFHAAYAVDCKVQNFQARDFLPIANFANWDFGSFRCEFDNLHAFASVPVVAGGISLERNNLCRIVDCSVQGPWIFGFQLCAYNSELIRPIVAGCDLSLDIYDSWHVLVADLVATRSGITGHITVGVQAPGNINRDLEFRRSTLLLPLPGPPVVSLQNNAVEGCYFSGRHNWDACSAAADNSGGTTLVSTGNQVTAEEINLDGTRTTATAGGLYVNGGSLIVEKFVSVQVSQAIRATGGALVHTGETRIDITNALQPPPLAAFKWGAVIDGGARWTFDHLVAPSGANLNTTTIVMYSFGEFGDAEFSGAPGGSAVYAGTVRERGRLIVTGGQAMWNGTNHSRSTVQLNGATPVPVPFADITANDSVKLTPVTYVNPGRFPTYTITPGTGFSVVGDLLDTSTYAFEIS